MPSTQASLRAARIVAAMHPKTPALPSQTIQRGNNNSLDDSHGPILIFGLIVGILLAGSFLVWRHIRNPPDSPEPSPVVL